MNIVVIGGFPRSGTRQFADIMNGHPECTIQGEIESDSLRTLSKLVIDADSYLGKGRTQKAYIARRLRFVLETYRMVSKTSSEPLVWDFGKQNLGFKKPYAEYFHKELDALFSPSVDRLKLFICVRNIEKNFLSLSGAFGYSIERFKKGIIDTNESLCAISKNNFFEVYPLHLDAFIEKSDDEKGNWLIQSVFSKLNLDIAPKNAAEIYLKTMNRNKTPAEKKRGPITDAEREKISGDRSFMKHVESIEARLGVTLR